MKTRLLSIVRHRDTLPFVVFAVPVLAFFGYGLLQVKL